MGATKQRQIRLSVASMILTGLALILLTAAGLTWSASSQGDAGDTEHMEGSVAEVLPPASATDTTTGTLDIQRSPQVIPANELSDPQDVARPQGPRPVFVRIDSIELAAPVVASGVDRDTGLMEVPANVDQVAWYRYGPEPGQVGSAVLAAHVDLAGKGPGVFFRLSDVEPGDSISVEFEDGTVRWFSARGRVTYQKEELPLDTIFSREGSPILVLITCGGVFSDVERSYDSNVVVYAVPDPVQGDIDGP